jgi:hypothetical protein
MRSLVVAALMGLAATLLAPSAANAASCWQRLLDDWRDGRISRVYPIQCYRDALKHLPEDLRVYGSAEDDIEHALSGELARTALTAPRAAATVHVATTRSIARRSRAPSRRLAGHTTKKRTSAARPSGSTQRTLRLAAASDASAASSRSPVAIAAWAGLALVAATLVAVSLGRHLHIRRRGAR